MRKYRPLLICLVGIDGSGKTTQANKLVNWLERDGINCKYIHNLSVPFITKPFITAGKRIFFKGIGKFENYKYFSESKEKVFGNYLLASGYVLFTILEHVLQSWWRLIVPLMAHNTIICDRYFYDLIVDLAVDLHKSSSEINNMVELISRLVPNPDITFLIDVHEDTAYERKDDVPSIFFLKERRQVYLNYATGKSNFIILDGSQNPEILQTQIWEAIKKSTK